MQVTLTNLSSNPVYVSQIYRQLDVGESVTTARTMAQIEADAGLVALIAAGTVGITYAKDSGDDVAGAGNLIETGIVNVETVMQAVAAGAGGSADDVTVYTADAPFAFDIVDVTFLVATAVVGSTCTLRDAVAGGGNALSDALSTAATGVKRNATATAPVAVAKGGSVYLHRSDSGVAGTLLISIARKS